MLQKKEMQEYCKQYHKKHYVSDTTTRDTKNHEQLGKLLLTLVGLSKDDAGTMISAKETNYTYNEFSESDLLVINQQALANTLAYSRTTIGRLLTKAEELGYVRFCDKYTVKDAKFPSDTYFIGIDKIMEDFADLNLSAKNLAYNYHNDLHVKDEGVSSKIAINNRCMTQPIWQDLKSRIDEANESIPDKFKVKFLNKHEDGNYYDSRYFTILCNTENPERHPDSDRYELVNELFGTNNAKIIEIDVNSMMYRTSYNLIHDKYLDKNADVYYELYKLMVTEPMTLAQFKKDCRSIIKKELMSIYMDPRSVYCKSKSQNTTNLNEQQIEHTKSVVITLFGMNYSEFLERLKEALYRFLSVYDFDGDKRIFFGRMFMKYESAVYYFMHEEFKSRGIKSANVYDGFYFIEGTCNEDTFYEVYEEAINKTKAFLASHNHDLVKLYGKTFKLKYRIYKKVESKSYPKTERQKGTYDLPTTKVVEHVDAETHNESRNGYIDDVKRKALEREAKGLKGCY